MTAVEQIKAAQQSKLVETGGEPIMLQIGSPLTTEEIDSLAKRLGQNLPAELRSLLQFCSSVQGCPFDIDFTRANLAFAMEDIFPNALPIASDGCGDFWILDITPQTIEAAPVLLALHDPPIILYQNSNIADFLAEIFRFCVPPNESLIDDVFDDKLFQVWRKNPGVIERTAALNSSEPALHSFAAELPEQFQIIDLRNARPGMGFSWGRYGPGTEVRRYGTERIFAYAKPPTRGFFEKIFGK